MKIMWVTMSAIGKLAELFYGKKTQSGGWIDATYERLIPYIKNADLDLHIIALGDKDHAVYDEASCVTYHMLNLKRFRGKAVPKKEIDVWKKLINDIAPDLIQIWGTEFTFGKAIQQAAGDIPVCYYIQGVMNVLSQHPAGDIPLKSLFKETGFLSILKFRAMRKEIKSNKKHIIFEKEMIKSADGIILDNMWTEAQYATYTDKFFTVPLALNKQFLECDWKIENCEPHTLFTVAGGASPIKGIHNVVLAIARLKEKYPNIRLNIPGNISSAKPHLIYDTIFIRHIRKLIKRYGLESNIKFVGQLKAKEMAVQLCKANVFIMPSCVETHSSSLREAMSVGCPVISAAVGSVFEFVHHGEDGFLYRYDDIESLAYFIDKVFSNSMLSSKLGERAKISIQEKYPQEEIGGMLIDAYKQMINSK